MPAPKPLTGFGSPDPGLSLMPVSLTFNNVPGATSTQQTITVKNTGTDALQISAPTVISPTFTPSTTCAVLAPGAICTITIIFTPGTANAADTLSIPVTSLTNGTITYTVPLTGTGAQSHLQTSPASLNFGSLALAASANLSLTLSNTGTAPITNLVLTITGDYAITTPCALSTLTPGTSCSVILSFTPTALGAHPGTLTVISSDANFPTILPLTGTGVPNGTFSLTASGNASVTVKSGSPATYPLALTPQNNFNGTIILNCTPITPGQYASCSLLPSSVALNGAAQNAAAIINTVTSATATTAQSHHTFGGNAILCLLPAALLFFWKTHSTQNRARLCTLLIAAATFLFTLSGCGSGGTLNLADPTLRRTPPGVYQYEITATSTTSPRITQTVTLHLTVQ